MNKWLLDVNEGLPELEDVFAAAHLKRLDLTLVTANERASKRVGNLHVENWLAG